MQNKNSQAIILRFFQALHTLKERKAIRGIKTVTDRYGINRRNFWELERNPSRDMFEVEWLALVCRDYDINPFWLLLGRGDMFTGDAIKEVSAALFDRLKSNDFAPNVQTTCEYNKQELQNADN